MTSWANARVNPLKKSEPSVRYYYSSDEDYASSTLGLLYSFVYCQRTAEPFYIKDNQGYFQPLLKVSPILHYLKENPASGTNMATNKGEMATVLNNMPLNTLRRNIQSIYSYNGETKGRIDTFITNFGINRQSFDIGIVLDISGCVPQVISGLKTFQKRTGKKTLKVFVMTEDMHLLQEFAQKGDPSWSYLSMMRFNAPQDPTYRLLKTLSEITILRQLEFVAVKLSSSVGKLIYLTSEKITSESQVISIDGSSWKAI